MKPWLMQTKGILRDCKGTELTFASAQLDHKKSVSVSGSPALIAQRNAVR